jgi:hypothetical protein
MKRTICYLSSLFILISLSGFAQSKNKKTAAASTGSHCFDESTKIINVGIGFWGNNYYGYGRGGFYSYHSIPAISVSYEQALPKKLGPGYLGVGAYLGYQKFWWRYDNYYYQNSRYYYTHNWAYTFIAARAAYHADMLMTDKAELYFGLSLGIRINKYSFVTNAPNPDVYYNEYHERTIYPAAAVFVGGRAYLTPKIALFAELGYGMSWLTGGVSIKL